jgi:hypothetical protein
MILRFSSQPNSLHSQIFRKIGQKKAEPNGPNEEQGTVMERSKPVPHDLTIPCPRPTHRCRRAPRLKTCPAVRPCPSAIWYQLAGSAGVHHGPCPSRRRASAWQQPAAKGSEPCVGGPVTVDLDHPVVFCTRSSSRAGRLTNQAGRTELRQTQRIF